VTVRRDQYRAPHRNLLSRRSFRNRSCVPETGKRRDPAHALVLVSTSKLFPPARLELTGPSPFVRTDAHEGRPGRWPWGDPAGYRPLRWRERALRPDSRQRRRLFSKMAAVHLSRCGAQRGSFVSAPSSGALT
jgi:hypothetical protein